MSPSPLQIYRMLLAAGKLQPDRAQELAAVALDALYTKLKNYTPSLKPRFGFGRGAKEPPPAGIYIHGDVGRGKSILMDLFFASLPGARKRRVHFNGFMTETHLRLHEWRNLSVQERRKREEFVRDAGDDPIAPIAKRIRLQATTLCLDEFQVSDVADAMILGRLFEKLISYGVVIVLTSNTEPERLYEGGINRQLFLPFIALIAERLDLIELNGPRDYRQKRMQGVKVYNAPLGGDATAAMDSAWRKLVNGLEAKSASLEVMGRSLSIPRAAHGVARFSFQELCGEALGPADYLALARQYHTLLIDDIPRLGPEDANEARRFTLLIDTLYDEKVTLICSAAVAPEELYANGDNSPAFRRAASRLVEMQSEDYLRSHSALYGNSAKPEKRPVSEPAGRASAPNLSNKTQRAPRNQ